MPANFASSEALSQKKMKYIYWKTFVGFVSRGECRSTVTSPSSEKAKLKRREGSFEYMELTSSDTVSLQCESDTSSPAENSPAEGPGPATYAVLDMSRKREINLSNEIAALQESPVQRQSELSYTDKDNGWFADIDDASTEGDSFDRLESTSPSMEPAPWKDQCEMVQRWVVPHKLSDGEEEVKSFPDAIQIPDFEYCHYVPTLEAIMEESEDNLDAQSKLRHGRSKSASFSDLSGSRPRFELTEGVKSSSTNDVSIIYTQSHDDLYSIATTFGSLSSMRRLSTFENLSFDEDTDEETDGSSDELDRDCKVIPFRCHGEISAQETSETCEKLNGHGENIYDLSHDQRAQIIARDGSEIANREQDESRGKQGVSELTRFSDSFQPHEQTIDHDTNKTTKREYDMHTPKLCSISKNANENVGQTCEIGEEHHFQQITANESSAFVNRDPAEYRKTRESSEWGAELFPTEKLSEGSSENNLSEYDNVEKNEQRGEKKIPAVPNDVVASASASSSPYFGSGSSRDAIAGSSRQSMEDLELRDSDRESPIAEIDSSPYDVKDSVAPSTSPLHQNFGPDDVTGDTRIAAANSKFEFSTEGEINFPGLPDELYFDSRDIPKIVVMFAHEELEKERREKEREKGGESGGDVLSYRKRSFTNEDDLNRESWHSSREVVSQRISQIKASEAARLSTLSSSTPELSATLDEALLYIPVSYASEAAAKKKKKRRVTMSTASAKTLQSKVLISGTGLGSGFGSIRKRFKGRKSTRSTLTRSQSEKPSHSYSSPDVSGPMSRLLHSPRLSKLRGETESPPKGDGRRRGIRSVVSNILRRLSSRFVSHDRPSRDSERDDVVENICSDSQVQLGAVKEESFTSESVSVCSSTQRSSERTCEMSAIGAPSQRSSSTDVLLDVAGSAMNFRERSASVPVRSRSQESSTKYISAESDVFESLQSGESGSLDRTVYV